MALRPSFSIEDVRNQMDLAHTLFKRTLATRLSYLGEQCTNLARERGSYIDQTGNLRSSTGYVVIIDGEILKRGGFEIITGSETSKEKGDEIGLELANKLASEIDGNGLIVVAGMNYASYVESKGYDVLSSVEIYAKSEVPAILQKLSDQLKNRKL